MVSQVLDMLLLYGILIARALKLYTKFYAEPPDMCAMITCILLTHMGVSPPGYHPSADSRRAGVSYKRKYVNKALVNRLVKLAQEKVWLGELTVPT